MFKDKETPNITSKKIISILKLVVLIGIIVALPIFLLFTHADDIQGLRNMENVKEVANFIDSEFKIQSMLIYIGLQILQIVISIIPGQIFQIAAGYLYGFPIGLGLSIIGAGLGSTIAYILAVVLGREALIHLASPDTLDYWTKRLTSKQAYIIVFILYLIPGLPKDVIAYAAGLSRMDIRAYLILSLVGRIPAMSASILIGAFYESGKYYGVGVVASISIIIFIICIIYRKKLSEYADRFYNRFS